MEESVAELVDMGFDAKQAERALTSTRVSGKCRVDRALAWLLVRTTTSSETRTVVIDCCNVAFCHTDGVSFSAEAVVIAVKHFQRHCWSVIGISPAFRIRYNGLMKRLRQQGVVFPVPDNTNDDLYVLHAARRNDAYILSNDSFVAELRGMDATQRAVYSKMLEERRISFIWIRDQFIPAID